MFGILEHLLHTVQRITNKGADYTVYMHRLPQFDESISTYRPLVKSAYQKNKFSYFSAKTYDVGTQKNRLNETVLLSTQNIC